MAASIGTRFLVSTCVTALALSLLAACDSGTVGSDPAVSTTLTWEPPTANTDDTALTDLAGYRLYWGASTGAYTNNQDLGMASCADMAGTMTCTYTLTGLDAGTYFFAVTAYNVGGYESVRSNEATATY